MRKNKALRFSMDFGLFIGLIISLLFTVNLTKGGLNSPHKEIGLVLMVCAGFFAGMLLIQLYALWRLINKRTVYPAKMHFNKPGTANNEGENAKAGIPIKSSFLKIPKRTGMLLSVLLILTCSVIGLIMSQTGLGLVMMAFAGFFGFFLIIIVPAKPNFFDKTQGNVSQ